MFKLHLIFVVNIKFPRATYHKIVPSTEEHYCLNSVKFLQIQCSEEMNLWILKNSKCFALVLTKGVKNSCYLFISALVKET